MVVPDTIHEWREKVTVTAGYVSEEGDVTAEVGFNEDESCWTWYVAIYEDGDRVGIVNHCGDVANSKDEAIEAANKWMASQGL